MNDGKCPYYKGLQKKGRQTFISCDNALLQYADDNEPDRSFFSTDCCLSINDESPYACRAFLITSIQSKKANVGSSHSIPELQQIYERVKTRPGCGDCEFYWWSAGYENAAEPSKITGFDGWKEWQSRKIPCEIFTHYCRPEYSTLHKITDGELDFCVRQLPQVSEQEVTAMPNKNGFADSDAGILMEKRSIEVITTEIQFYKNQAGEAILEIGRRLNEAKEQLQHGEWLDWLQKKVEFSERAAQNMMRIAREYSNPQMVADLGSSKALVMLALSPGERDEFMSEPHDVEGKPKTVDEMSKRELEQAVRERKEALDAKEAAECQAEEQRRLTQEALDRAAEAAADAKRAEDEKSELERQLDELRSAEPELPPEPDQQTLDAVRKEAASEAKKEAEEKLKRKIAKADEDKSKAEAALAAAERERDRIKQQREQEQAAASDKITRLEKQLAAGSQAMAVFKTYFESVQVSLNKMLDCIHEADDDATRDKLSAALRALCEKVMKNT